MDEVSALDLRGKLVVLSACSSVDGALLQGEDVMGLARGFFEAGPIAVVGAWAAWVVIGDARVPPVTVRPSVLVPSVWLLLGAPIVLVATPPFHGDRAASAARCIAAT